MRKSNKRNNWRAILMPFLALLMVFSTVLPSVSVANELPEINIGMEVQDENGVRITLTEEIVNKGGLNLVFTLDSEKAWVTSINDSESKKKLVLAAIEEFVNDLKLSNVSGISYLVDSNKLSVKIPAVPSYELFVNKTYTINFSPALIENWPGKVSPIEISVYAKPRITLGGSIVNNTTLENIQKGGKVIELKLLNATWNEEKFNTITKLNGFLEQFKSKNGADTWDVAKQLSNKDPNEVIYFADEQTLQLKLPAIPDANDSGKINIDSLDGFYNVRGDIGGIGGLIEDERFPSEFMIENIPNGIPTLTISESIKEKDVLKTKDDTVLDQRVSLELKLANTAWDLSTAAKKLALIDSFTTKDQPAEWDKVKEALQETVEEPNNWKVNNKAIPNTSILTIKLPEIKKEYLLEKDQIINVNIPYQVLTHNVNLNSASFTIIAQPKVLLSGTAMPEISQTDFAKGGKTIMLTLVNGEWQKDIVTNTAKREKLLKSFLWKDLEDEMLARADVIRTNNRTVTIKLPAVTQKFSGNVGFNSSTLKDLLIVKEDFLEDSSELTVSPVENQSAVIKATNKINDLDIVKGGETVVITLKNDTWKPSLKDLNDFTPITLTTDDNKPIDYTLISSNSSTATLKLKANKDFSLDSDQNVKIKIPEDLLSVRNKGPLTIESAFKIAAVTASLSGTGVTMDPVDVQKGNKTLIVTLNNAEFKKDLTVEDVIGLFNYNGTLPWTITPADFTAKKNKLTIKLPANPTYVATNTESFNLVVKSNLLDGHSDAGSIVEKKVEKGTVTIGADASAILESGLLKESDIQAGKEKLTITLTDAIWNPTIETNASKKSALMKGFAVTDQTKEWSLVTSAIAKNGKFSVSNSGKTLTIELPEIPDYSIVRDQQIKVTVPKSVLDQYKYDIEISQSFSVKVPDIQSDSSFAEVLGSGLVDYIDQNGMNNIRVKVPEKVIQTISTYAAELGDSSVSTIEVVTEGAAKKVVATILSEEGEVAKESDVKVNNRFTFVFADVQPNSTLQIEVFSDADEKIDESFNKMTKGNKAFTEVPKNQLDGNYSLYSLLTEKSLLSNILKYYSLEELKIGTIN